MRHTDKAEVKGDGIKVLVRIRPPTESERLADDNTHAVKAVDDYTCTICPPKNKQRSEEACTFTFDSILQETAPQEEVFQKVGIPILENVLDGYNSTIFAYGQTGAGKTHTMIGIPDETRTGVSDQGGLAPRSFEYLFKRISEVTQAAKEGSEGGFAEIHFAVRCSVLEIYNENITDLLNPKETNLMLREDPPRGAFVDGLKEFSVHTAGEALQLLFLGASNRKTANTRANAKSSRSHYIYTCMVERTSKSVEGICQTRHSRLNLVDLAGSERNRFSGAKNSNLKEACHINQSLSTLGRVIKELVESQHHGRGHIPYRDSKLTYLLQESLGGNAKTTIIANISPSSLWYHETLSTLQFVRRAKYIRNNARVNEESDGKESTMALKLKIKRLEEELRMRPVAERKPSEDDRQLAEQLRIMTEERDHLKEQWNAAAEEVDDLKELLKSKTQQVDEVEHLLSTAQESIECLKVEKRKLLKDITVLREEQTAMQKSLRLVMHKVSDAQATALVADEEAGKLSAMEREVLMRELEQEEMERLQGGKVITDLKEALASMTQQLEASRAREHEMMVELEMERETVEKQQWDLERIHEELVASEKERKEQHSSLAAVSEQLNREKDASAGLEAALENTRIELVHARDNICLTQDATIRKDQELESLHRVKTDSQKEAHDLRDENKKMETQLDKMAVQCTKLERVVAEQGQQIIQLKNRCDELISTREDREQEIYYLKQMIEDIEIRCDRAEASNEELLAECEQTKRAKYTLENLHENVADIIQDIERATPPDIKSSLRWYSVGQDSRTCDSALGSVSGGRGRYSVSPEAMAFSRMHSGLADYPPVHAVEVGSCS